jgi:hydrogenase 3 maturation protease
MPTTAAHIQRLLSGRHATVVGVGHRLRGDDAVGSLLAAGLQAEFGGDVIDAGEVPENFLGLLTGPGRHTVLFLDAADHGAAPGAWCLAPTHRLAARAGSTHAASLRLLAQLLEAHGVQSWVLGIQPLSNAPGAPLSGPVRAAAHELHGLLAGALRAGSAA